MAENLLKKLHLDSLIQIIEESFEWFFYSETPQISKLHKNDWSIFLIYLWDRFKLSKK